MKAKSKMPSFVLLVIALVLFQSVLSAVGLSGSIAMFFAGLGCSYWIMFGYGKVFGGLLAVATMRDALRGLIIATCWPFFILDKNKSGNPNA